MHWDKKKIQNLLLRTMRAELDATLHAANTAKEGATHEEAVAKSKYDTHGLELSYLAGSQFERARQAEAKILLLESTGFKNFTDEDIVDVGAIVVVEDSLKKLRQNYLVSNIGAGLSLSYDGEEILVISPESPLGEAMLSLGVGDEIPAKSSKSPLEIIALA